MIGKLSRQRFLASGVALGAGTVLGLRGARAASQTVVLPFANGARPLAAYPQKRPLIVLTSRPVQLETPFEIFNEGAFTPNDAFFVRWHLAGMPTEIDASSFRLNVHGLVDRPLQLSIDDLRKNFEPVEIAAVCECSGNSRGFFQPRVPGGEWANGAMGNARWKGARLKDILAKAAIKSGALQVRFNGMDKPVLSGTPDFVKALDVDVATGPDVLVAYEMNGGALPVLNGFPVRLVVPGWYSTYWVKMLDDVEVIDHVEDNFWMKTAYRIPANDCGCVEPGTTGFKTVPINHLTVRSFVTSLADGASVKGGAPLVVRGIAFDGGSGIKSVALSTDGDATRLDTTLGDDYGKYSFREWKASFTPEAGKSYTLVPYATSNAGEAQRTERRWNPSGYLLNAPVPVKVSAA